MRTQQLRHSASGKYAEAEKEDHRHSESEVSSVRGMDKSG
jgi:hypothetical protein